MKMCSYIVRHDSGLAPNPFWGHCTLGLCTPNHMGIKLESDDWIVGFQSGTVGGRLVYAMKVGEKLHFNSYFHDERFQDKRPATPTDWQKRCGDNMYFLGSDGTWEQLPVLMHNTPEQIAQDTKHPYVYIGQQFYYFGEAAPEIPLEFTDLVWGRQGCKCNHSQTQMEGLIQWLQSGFAPGIHGLPKHRHLFMQQADNSQPYLCKQHKHTVPASERLMRKSCR